MKELKELVFSTRGAISVISRSPSPNPQGWGRVNPSLRARTMCARTTGRSGAAQRRRRCENRLCMPPSSSARARGCRMRKMPKMTSAQIMVRDERLRCNGVPGGSLGGRVVASRERHCLICAAECGEGARLTACNVRLIFGAGAGAWETLDIPTRGARVSLWCRPRPGLVAGASLRGPCTRWSRPMSDVAPPGGAGARDRRAETGPPGLGGGRVDNLCLSLCAHDE